MNRIFKPSFESNDERGFLREIVAQGDWKTVNLSFRKKGSVLGNHYHKDMDELIYVISGKMNLKLEDINSRVVEEFEIKENEGFIVKPYEIHTLKVLEDSMFIALLSEKFDKDNPDLHKL